MTVSIHSITVAGAFFRNYTYIIKDIETNTLALIDPAWQKAKIARWVSLIGGKPMMILLTHHHFDHMHLAAYFARKFAVPMVMSRIEAEYYHLKKARTTLVEDRQPITLGNSTITPYLTPGHTKGGISYYVDGHLFTGDTLFITGCGLCAPRTGGDPLELFDSLRLIKDEFAADTRIYPGHPYGEANGQTLEEIRKKNMYLQFTDAQRFVEFRMRKMMPKLFNFKKYKKPGP